MLDTPVPESKSATIGGSKIGSRTVFHPRVFCSRLTEDFSNVSGWEGGPYVLLRQSDLGVVVVRTTKFSLETIRLPFLLSTDKSKRNKTDNHSNL